jgi:hypothetical protein
MTNGKHRKKKNKEIGRCKRLAPNNVDFQPVRYTTVHPTFLFWDYKHTLFF